MSVTDVFLMWRQGIREDRRSFERAGGGFVVVVLGFVPRTSTRPICEFILRTDKAGFRDIDTPNEWQKRQWGGRGSCLE